MQCTFEIRSVYNCGCAALGMQSSPDLGSRIVRGTERLVKLLGENCCSNNLVEKSDYNTRGLIPQLLRHGQLQFSAYLVLWLGAPTCHVHNRGGTAAR
jgi:hypothetical protein